MTLVVVSIVFAIATVNSIAVAITIVIAVAVGIFATWYGSFACCSTF